MFMGSCPNQAWIANLLPLLCFLYTKFECVTKFQYVVPDGKIPTDGAGRTANGAQGRTLVLPFWLKILFGYYLIIVFYSKCSRMLCAYFSNSEFGKFSIKPK